jgi:hypothetical protein
VLVRRHRHKPRLGLVDFLIIVAALGLKFGTFALDLAGQLVARLDSYVSFFEKLLDRFIGINRPRPSR